MRSANPFSPGIEDLESRLLLSGASPADLLAGSEAIDLLPADTVRIGDAIAGGSPARSVHFTATARGKVALSMQGEDGGLDPILSVYSAAGRRIRFNDNAAGSSDSLIRLSVKPGRTYYVVSSSADDTTGAYSLTLTSVPRDDHGGSFAEARTVRLSQIGAGRARGAIHYAGDEDVFSFVATRTGTMRVELAAPGRDPLSGRLAAYDADQQAMASGGIGAMSLDVVAGQTYYLHMSGADGSKGRYRLRIHPTEVAALEETEQVILPPAGTTTVSGRLAAGASSAYEFRPAARGRIVIALSGSAAGNLLLEVYDARGRVVASGTAQTAFQAQPGRTYYAVVSSADGQAGTFEMALTSDPADDHANSPEDAKVLTTVDGARTIFGKVHYAGDVDVMAVAADRTGTMTVSISNVGAGNRLEGAVSIYDAGGNLIAAGGEAVGFEAVEGETYYVQASGQDGTEGRYRLDVATEPAPAVTAWAEPVVGTANSLDEIPAAMASLVNPTYAGLVSITQTDALLGLSTVKGPTLHPELFVPGTITGPGGLQLSDATEFQSLVDSGLVVLSTDANPIIVTV
ncbi:MAG: hypothetical protein ACYS5V_10355 [Planctomycetota bacterium]|jgi:hypothetical protein